jgi:cyclohexanone monooxygenase
MSLSERTALDGDYDAVVVGAGFGGLYALHRLREVGLSVIGFEAAPEVGGTWYWNRYPGVRCDVPSLYYSYTWSSDLRREWRWSEKYATQREILDYARYVAERFELRDLIRFETRVTAAAFNEADAIWQVQTDRGDRIRARFCVMASGCLSVPNNPKVPDIESFRGPIYHTARWPEEAVDFSGLRVGVIGTGSSGVQAIPLIAAAAAQTVVFQRTPNFSVPARNRPLHDADYEQFEAAYPAYLESLESPNFGRVNAAAFEAPIPSREEQWRRYEELWREGGGGFLLSFPNLFTHEAVNDVACDFVREKISQIEKNPKTAAALSPTCYPLGVKRICVDTNYYETFNRENVELVNLKQEPIDRITADGVRTSARQFELDALVFATGFDAITGALFAMDIRGRNDLAFARGMERRAARLSRPHRGGFSQPVHHHRPRKPVGDRQHDQRMRTARRLVGGLHRLHAQARFANPGGGACGRTRLDDARRRDGRANPLSESELLVSWRQHRGQAARLHALCRRRLQVQMR